MHEQILTLSGSHSPRSRCIRQFSVSMVTAGCRQAVFDKCNMNKHEACTTHQDNFAGISGAVTEWKGCAHVTHSVLQLLLTELNLV